MKLILLISVVFVLAGCATTSPQTRQVLKNPPNVPAQFEIAEVEFVDQETGDCGPSALTSIFNWAGEPVALEQIHSEVFTPSKNGTLQTDLISASRRHGFMAITMKGLPDLLTEVADGHPVIVFQNLGFSAMPKWHYSVVTGYDLKNQEIIVLAKNPKDRRVPMTYFERYWQLAEYWGLLVLHPNQMSATADEIGHMRAAAGLEQAGKFSEAETAYQNILKRWPQSLSALIGLGNISFRKMEYAASVRFLKQAVQFHPDSVAARHNLETAKKALQ